MAQRYDIVKIDFQANARGANAAIESLRKAAEDCQNRVKQLKKDLADGIKMGKSTEEIENIRKSIAAAQKEARSFQKGYDELAKGMRTLDTAIKAFNDGSLAQMSQAFQKAANNAAKLTRTKLDPLSDTYKEDYRQLTALMDATQQNFARMQGDAQQMVKTLKEGGKVSVAALQEEIKAQQELLLVLAQTDKGYQQTERRLAVMQQYLRAMGGDYEFVRQNITDTKKVSDDMLRNMYAELQKTNQEGKVTKDIMRENAAAMKEIRTEQARRVENVLGGNLGQQSEQAIRAAIANAKELLVTYKSNSREAQTLSAQIVNAEEHLRTHGIEAARAAQREAAAIKTQEEAEKQLQATMNKRLQSLKTLSADALAETRKYWEAQRNGAEQGSAAYKKAEDALKRIDNLQKSRRVGELDNILGDPSKHGIAEVRNAVQEMEKLRDSVQQGIPAWQHYNKMVEQGKAYLDNLAKNEAAERINQQMQQLSTLSATGLQEVKRYWETMVAGAAHGSDELDQYRTKLEQVMAEEKARSAAQAQQRVGILGGNLGGYSEAEIRQAIEAGKELIQTYKTADPAAQQLAQNIVAAEEHLKQYGVEAERAARKEAEAIAEAARKRQEADQLMQTQLQQGRSLTDSALKAQQQYWQRLIDDPKTASQSLQQYKANLAEVERLQRVMVLEKGNAALNFFRGDTSNASADQIKQQADAMKKYRDSLPQKDNAAVIAEIDGYLQEAAAAAQKATEQTMTWRQAMQVSAQAGTGSFKGTTEQLNQAKKTLEDMSVKAVKGGLAWRSMQDALQRIELELKNVGHLSQEVQAVLDQPKGKSFNALKQAVEQGRLALNAMDRSTKEGQKRFDELAAKVKAADIEMKNLAGSSKGTASAFDKAWSRLKTYVGLYVGAAVAMQKLTAAMGDLMTLSDKMGEVRKTTGFTADEVGRLSGNLAKLDTRTTLTSLMELSSLAGSVGLKTQQDVQGFTEAADQLIVALPELGNESARTIIKIANATGDLEKNGGNVRETLEKVGSTIIALRANSASAAGPITDFVSRVGAVGAQAGISIDQIAALGSTIDALGGRVEMSATALSRMIPAIKNNSFAIANSIGVTEKYLKSLAPMEQMVLIFQKMRDNIAGIDTSTEQGQEQMAATIEGMLGKNATMREVMKDLEQQGARAGIVFGLLSQNVDELEKQLGIASEAYRENTALANEFNNMNETTAAKWERLKNQFEEAFVEDKAQRWLGWIIDRLRVVVDLLTGDGGISIALRTIIVYMTALRLKLADVAAGGLKALWTGIKNIGVALGFVKGELTKMQMANIFTALAAAALYAYHAFKQWHEETMAAAREAAQFEAELQKEQAKVEDLTKAVAKASVNVDDARAAVEKARKELDEAKKSADGSKESTERLTKAEKDLFDAENNLRKAQDDHTRSIQQINSQYGKYLGFMLSEVSSAEELAAARELINDKLRETINLKRKEAALGRIEESMGEGRDDRYADLSDLVSRGVTSKDSNGNRIQDPKKAARIMTDITKAAQQEYATAQDFTKAVYKILSQEGYVGDMWDAWKSNIAAKAQLYYKEVANIRKKNNEIEQQFAGEDAANRERSQKDLERQYKAAEKNYTVLEGEYAKATGNARKKAAANLLKQMDTINEMVDNSSNYYDLTNKDEKASYDQFIAGNEERIKGMQEQREALLKEAGEAYSARKRVGGGSTVPNPTNPYGSYNRVTSPYQDWDADALVSRRKEMLERVRALANGADVQAVLSEDAKFITEATRNNIKTTKDAIEWYNTERLKIQEALHEKHLTNTGDWMDPTGRKKREKTIKDEWSAYLNELDAYYTERKTRIQEAATEEGITEAEMKNRTLANEMEWHQRRAELQKLYARKSGEVTEEEQQAIFDILSERTGDTADFIQKTIGKTVKFIYDIGQHSEAEMRSIFGKLDKGIERDFLKQQQAVTTQMKAIRDIIEKERPYDGITSNLRENLVTMGILTADMTAERNRLMRENADRSDFNARQAAEEQKRTAFLLGEAENAYSTTIEEVMRHMGEQGMAAWADAIRGDTQMQQALMAQLRTAYDEIQNAIKKEASLIKKQTDIWWADIAEGQTQSRRDGFEKALSRLGLAEDQVKRANSLIGTGQASERVADRLAIKQMQVRLAMQMTYYNRMRQIGEERIAQLKAEGRLEDAEHLRRSLNLAKTEELKKLEEQRVAIANQMEESQNRLYTALREWGDLISSSIQGVFEASNTGQKEFYTEQAKKRLTGESTSGLYIVVENAGTKDAKASYQTLSDQEVLDIEQRNAMADAWKKLMDDLNMKMSETITDQLNAMVQNVSIDANTNALYANTQAVLGLTGAMEAEKVLGTGDMGVDENGVPNALKAPEAEEYDFGSAWSNTEGDGSGWDPETNSWVAQAEASTAAKETILKNQQDIAQGQVQTDTKIQKSTQSAFAKMTAASNLYGIAYQVMSNSNMSASQKAGMIAIQAAGNAAITGLNVAMSEAAARAATDSPGVLGKLWKTLGPVGASAMFAVFTGLLGGLMGLATSKIQKSKSEVAQATGVSASAGRLATGMLTYAEGNVNEFTDPSTLREGRQYNVDAADGRTYRARYMGRNPKTHLTNGPEFHLSGERGREMIIDAGTTRQITMNEAEIWHAIQTLSGGGSVRRLARRGRGVRAFADGNIEDFVDAGGDTIAAQGPGFDPAAMQASLDRNSAVQEALLERLQQPIQAEVSPYGPRGIVAGYDKAKKDAQRYGVKY